MTHPIRTSSHDSNADSIRKRVCKACDRCRLKKSKCDGLSPCTRCKADNAICVFGERKKSHDKVYPKGYVEMLEQQQNQLVAGLQEMYNKLQTAQAWVGPTLPEANGHPLTHDILSALNLLETKHDGTGETESFEEDYHKLQSKLLAEGAGYMQRRGSFSSESEHSQHSQHPTRSTSNNTAVVAQTPVFPESFNFSSPSSPAPLSPAPGKRQSHPPAQPLSSQQASPLSNDPQLYQPEWAMPNMSMPDQILRSKYAISTPQLQNGLPDFDMFNTFDTSSFEFDNTNMNSVSMTSYHPSSSLYDSNMQDLGSGLDPMFEVDYSKYVQSITT